MTTLNLSDEWIRNEHEKAMERFPDLLVAADVLQALADRPSSGDLSALERACGIRVDVSPSLPPGRIVACTKRGREILYGMREAAEAAADSRQERSQ